jgi:uncharacterized protein YicC (UPF0701 family)
MVAHLRLGQELLGESEGAAGITGKQHVGRVGSLWAEMMRAHRASIGWWSSRTLSPVPKLPGIEKGDPSEALRSAIERTFEATLDSAAGTRERAGELLDQVVRRGRGEVRRLERELGSINERLEKLESTIRRELRNRRS